MSDDLSEFHDVFFEEADELIESMEAELLEMLGDPDDSERINTVFRAAHSIKGGSATFGFVEIAELTHVMETLMDEVRSGRIRAEAPLVDLLLKATDVLRSMIEAAKGEDCADIDAMQSVKGALEEMLSSEASVEEHGLQTDEAPSTAMSPTLNIFDIVLKPARDALITANDPLMLLRELQKLGAARIELLAQDLPDIEHFDPECLYLGWRVELITDSDESDVREIFEWIDATSEVEISLVDPKEQAMHEKLPHESLAIDEPTTKAEVAPSTDPLGSPSDNRRPSAKKTTSIRVGTDKIDTLINLVGELVITQSMLNEEGSKLPIDLQEKLGEGLAQLQRHTRELQENVMKIRMVPISTVFNRLPRMVHDLTRKLGKQVELDISGEQTELDKTVLESIGDPLVHLVRNAIDHGIETQHERANSGKAVVGKVQLNAFHESGSIIIEIRDDGRGIDREIVLNKARDRGLVSTDRELSDAEVYDLLFHPGFSTAETVSDVSGRGVGMDVVRRNINELGGSVEVASALGEGSTFTIRLPLTLAIMDGQLLRVGDQTYVLPLTTIVESTLLDAKNINVIAGKGTLYRLRNEFMPLINLAGLFSLSHTTADESLIVVVESEQGKLGLLVDDLLAQQQVVIKSLRANYRHVDGVSGATILGDGTVALILDIDGICNLNRLRAHELLDRTIEAA